MLYAFAAAHLGLLYELGGVFLVFFAAICVGGVLISRFDGVSLEDAIYFAFITAFTVGFGDLAPKSRGARIVAVLLSLLGVLLVGIAVAISVNALDIALAARGN